MIDKEWFEKFINLKQSDLDNAFIKACQNEEFELMKYLLASSDLKHHADIHAADDDGFRWCCFNDNIQMAEYLLKSPDLKEHANMYAGDMQGFKSAYIKNYTEILKCLIFDMNIEETKDVKSFLERFPNESVENMFKIRDLNQKLGVELSANVMPVSKIKV